MDLVEIEMDGSYLNTCNPSFAFTLDDHCITEYLTIYMSSGINLSAIEVYVNNILSDRFKPTLLKIGDGLDVYMIESFICTFHIYPGSEVRLELITDKPPKYVRAEATVKLIPRDVGEMAYHYNRRFSHL